MERVIKTIRFPVAIIDEIQPFLDKSNLNFSNFVLKAIKNYIRVLDYEKGVQESFGAWDSNDRIRTENDINEYIRDLRKSRSF